MFDLVMQKMYEHFGRLSERLVDRQITLNVGTRLARAMIAGEVHEKSTVNVDVKNNVLTFAFI